MRDCYGLGEVDDSMYGRLALEHTPITTEITNSGSTSMRFIRLKRIALLHLSLSDKSLEHLRNKLTVRVRELK